MERQKQARRVIAAALALLSIAGCSLRVNKTLPPSSSLGQPRGYRIARSILHLHTPYSWDACDQRGLGGSGGTTPDGTCLLQLRDALCKNRIDFAMLTDHPDRMDQFTFAELTLQRPGDSPSPSAAAPIYNQMNCGDGTQPILSVGFEDKLMAMMMLDHTSPVQATRHTDYTTDPPTAANITTLHGGAVDAAVFVPHTESRSDALLTTLAAGGLDGLEIYNLHANMDPRIRSDYLGFSAFSGVLDFLNYWLDPYQSEEPDLALLSVLQIASTYADKWGKLIDQGYHLTGIAGSDSHQNVLGALGRDGERLDSHRRLLRWFSNHLLVNALTYAQAKTALKSERSWIAFEGLGSPVGMDFYAVAGATTIGPGETTAYVGGSTRITVKLPSLHPDSPSDGTAPTVILRLKEIVSGGASVLRAESSNADLVYTPTAAGRFRAEVFIIPRHLSGYIGYRRSELIRELPWIITNHLYLS